MKEKKIITGVRKNNRVFTLYWHKTIYELKGGDGSGTYTRITDIDWHGNTNC